MGEGNVAVVSKGNDMELFGDIDVFRVRELDDENLNAEGEEIGGHTVALTAASISLRKDVRLLPVHLKFYERILHESLEHVDEFVGKFEEFDCLK